MEKEYMKEAYGLLYEVENTLRLTIEHIMQNQYGEDWIIQAPLSMNYPTYKKHFSSFYYHELISFLKGYPCLAQLIPSTLFFQLQGTIQIRNKIAHCKLLSPEEFYSLREACKVVTELGVANGI